MIIEVNKIVNSEGDIQPDTDAVYWQKADGKETETTMMIEIFD